MRRRTRWWIALTVAVGVAGLVPLAGGLLLTQSPRFYRSQGHLPAESRREQARQFRNQVFQLRNDIANETEWQAAFSEQEINAWLSEDLLVQFADLLPPQIQEPRIAFEMNRVLLGFQANHLPFRPVVWAVILPAVTEARGLELIFERVSAGTIPVPAARYQEGLSRAAAELGLELTWREEASGPVATLRRKEPTAAASIRLSQIQVLPGLLRVTGQSTIDPARPGKTLSQLDWLQSLVPRRKLQRRGSAPTASAAPEGDAITVRPSEATPRK
jgi:hypothetical protein